jgi:group I intron endonuclease
MHIESILDKTDLHFSKRVCGIYIIQNEVSGKMYIGSSVNIYTRFSKHESDLKANRHHSPMLQNSWNKHGSSAFKFKVVEIVEDTSDLLSVEQRWLDKYSPEYNSCKVAGNRLGYKASDETRSKLSEALSGRTLSEETKKKLSELRMGKPSPISEEGRARCGRKGIPKPEGFGEKIRAAKLGKSRPPEVVEKIAQKKRKSYIFTDSEGVDWPVLGLRKFCKSQGLNASIMSDISRGKSKRTSHRGWSCKLA